LPILGRLVSRRIRGYVERFLAVLARPFRIEVMAVSESICGELCPRDRPRRRKESRKASGSGSARHRNVAVAFCQTCLRA
jgi:hypothetical protein